MKTRSHAWKRFWYPLASDFSLLDGGYLPDPEAKYGEIYNPFVAPYEAIADVPCLALLGAPGMGKSKALSEQYAAVARQARDQGDQALFIDLRAYQTDMMLQKAIFEDADFRAWSIGSHQLHLFLDSLDEARLRLGVVTTLLARELQKYPIERLRLRIACRTAEWPSSFEEDLQELWAQRIKAVESELDHAPEVAPPSVSVSSTSISPSAVLQPEYQQDNDAATDAMQQLAPQERRYIYAFVLAPLRRLDVATAAMDYGIDKAAFFSAIDRSRAVAFAINPTSLKFLLEIFSEKGSLPSARSELYEEGCRHLLGESMRARRDAKLAGLLSIDQQLEVASRIAAATMFTKRYSIQTNEYGDKADEGDITLRDVCSGNEDGLGLNAQMVQEVLETPLFSPRSAQQSVWSHQTYAEFLAARYLIQHNASLAQILTLITHSSDPNGKLIPQLYETAAWLASLRRDVFREIMAREPEVLLRSDVIGVSDHDRARLVEALLLLFDQEQLLDNRVDVRQSYPRLKHPGLVDQLRPYIGDRSKGWLVRRVAIDIAEGCELRELQDDLSAIALDPADFHPTRVNAAYAVMRIGDAEARTKLRPLVFGEAGDDPDDELKGCGLSATWPDHLTAAELFAALSPPKHRNFFGSYSMFFSDKLIEKLSVVDLPVALRWVEQQPAGRPWHTMQEVMNSIMLRAWEALETPGVLDSFASAVLERLRHHEEVVVEEQPFLRSRANGESDFATQLRSDHPRRRIVLGALLPLCTEPTEDALRLVFNHTPFAQYEDFRWLIERFEVASTAHEQRALIELITRVFSWSSQEHLEIAYDASQRIPALAGCFIIFQPIDLRSPEANRLRTDHLKRQERENRFAQQQFVEPPPAERVVRALDEFEAGKQAAWWQLNMQMTLKSTSTHYGSELESDLAGLPGWKGATSETRARIVSAANVYLRKAAPEPDHWRGTNTIYRPAFAGYRALRLLLQVAPELLLQLPAAVWQRWAPIIIAYPITHGDGKEGPHIELVRLAYQQAPVEIIESLLFEIDHENSESESIWVIDKVERCLDQHMSAALLTKASDATLKPGCLASLLEFLLKHEVGGARSFAESLIAIPVPQEAAARTKMLRACIALMTLTEDAAWTSLWLVFQHDNAFGQDIISAVAHGAGLHGEGVVHRLTPDQVADLYIWLVRCYPPNEDPQDDLNDDIMHAVTPHESVMMWRDSLLRELQQRGTFQAVEALRRIIKEVPEMPALKWALLDAQSEARRQTWIAPQPAYVLDLVGHQDKRFVRNGRELLEVLCESLIRLEAKLRGETPAAIDLWNEVGGKIKRYTPKDENRLSDYVKRHLNEDLKARGIIVGRELEFRRSTGGRPGERIDIMVDAVVFGHERTDHDTISVVIETKGCWHRDLNQAMQTQLVERYLLESSCRYGLYLVGWFNCDQWDPNDYRKRQVPKIDRAQAQAKFDRQAMELSREGLLIRTYVLNVAL